MSCLMSYKQKFMPLALTNVTCPGTWIGSHWCSPHEQSSHIGRSASVGLSETITLYRWHRLRSSFMESWPLPSVILAHLNISHSVSPISKWADSSFIYWYSLYTQFAMATDIDRVTALHFLLKVGHSGTGEMLHIFVLLSAKEIDFCMTSEVRSWVATLSQLMVLLGGRLME